MKNSYKLRITPSASVTVVLIYLSKLCSSFLCSLLLLASINLKEICYKLQRNYSLKIAQ
ncbi:hypothetical protein U732_4272 [Clostridium argentinense CDC 2741]|uniref:Uncharacterized protein n=1 Tax=Clostridium argentinense CDC 2741 TaxID=1418104 RepID=A0A0C1U6U5_9CLOT|nr:hypothetical protein U732_4272 [Clostridium argentinense CDC 2741]